MRIRWISSLFLALIFLFLFISCQKKEIDPSYLAEINQWHQKRIANLKKPEGWLSLVGLYWLQEGENSFGSSEKNDITFPQKAPAFIGTFVLHANKVKVVINPDIPVLVNDTIKKEAELQHDLSGHPTKMKLGSLVWYVIKRGEKYGIRLKDTLSAVRMKFKGIDRFPVDPKYRVVATFIPYNPPKKIIIPTIIGTEEVSYSPGALEFELDGEKYRLDPEGEMGDKEWFIVFGDATNGKETYGAGRFLYVPAPDSTGKTIIDFNKAYNPPCAFTPYATCPLPPEQNILPVAIRAGEKNYGEGHH